MDVVSETFFNFEHGPADERGEGGFGEVITSKSHFHIPSSRVAYDSLFILHWIQYYNIGFADFLLIYILLLYLDFYYHRAIEETNRTWLGCILPITTKAGKKENNKLIKHTLALLTITLREGFIVCFLTHS